MKHAPLPVRALICATLTATVTAALVAGCAGRPTDGGGAGETDERLRGRTFLSTAVSESGRPRQLAADTRVSLQFTDDGRLLVQAGCNTMSGPVQTRGDRLGVSDLSITDIGCDPPRHEQDDWLAGLLNAGPSWRLDGTTLTLTTGDTELVLADREVAEPDLALEGPTWVVDTILDPDVASSTPAGVSASVIFKAGRATVSTGCNTGSAGYQVRGDKLTLSALAITRMACEPDVMRLEQAMLAVLDGEVAFAVEANRLRLDHPSGKGLQLRAER